MPQAELIFTGDELLRGEVVNTNQSLLAEALLRLGVETTRAVCIPDGRTEIAFAIRDSLSRGASLLILTGGLGPTPDDLTREGVADALGLALEPREELLRVIEQRFARFGRPMEDSNLKQATIPQGSDPLQPVGTAPGFYLEHEGSLLIALPGPPSELRTMWAEQVEPLLSRRFAGGPGEDQRFIRRLRLFGLGESSVAERLQDLDWREGPITIGTRSNADGVLVVLRSGLGADRLEGVGPAEAEKADAGELQRALDHAEQSVRDRLAPHVYGSDDETLADAVGRLLRERRATVATAESCTGGLLGKLLTDRGGSSDYFLGGVISYSNSLKETLLGVDAELLRSKGAVSPEVAEAMARGASSRTGADYALSTTGVAGPGGGSPEKPVGLVYVGLARGEEVEVKEFRFPGDREAVRIRTANSSLDLLRRRLLSPAPRSS